MSWQKRRKKPYTERAIKRLKCIRCGSLAKYQWQICSDGNNYRPLCVECDIALNRLVLTWMGHPSAEQTADEYAMAKKKEDS